MTIGLKKIRIKKILSESSASTNATNVLWYHLHCFAKHCDKLGWIEGAEQLPGFNELKPKDKDIVKQKIK